MQLRPGNSVIYISLMICRYLVVMYLHAMVVHNCMLCIKCLDTVAMVTRRYNKMLVVSYWDVHLTSYMKLLMCTPARQMENLGFLCRKRVAKAFRQVAKQPLSQY